MAIPVVILCGASETATFVEQFAATSEDWLIKFFKTAASVVRHLKKYPADLIIVSMVGRPFRTWRDSPNFTTWSQSRRY